MNEMTVLQNVTLNDRLKDMSDSWEINIIRI